MLKLTPGHLLEMVDEDISIAVRLSLLHSADSFSGTKFVKFVSLAVAEMIYSLMAMGPQEPKTSGSISLNS